MTELGNRIDKVKHFVGIKHFAKALKLSDQLFAKKLYERPQSNIGRNYRLNENQKEKLLGLILEVEKVMSFFIS